jgi:hypothetical protein
MFATARLATASAIFAALAFNASAAGFPTVPPAALADFCQMHTAGVHVATFFMNDGLRLQGHVNCTKVSFTLGAILPPIDEQILSSKS